MKLVLLFLYFRGLCNAILRREMNKIQYLLNMSFFISFQRRVYFERVPQAQNYPQYYTNGQEKRYSNVFHVLHVAHRHELHQTFESSPRVILIFRFVYQVFWLIYIYMYIF